MVNLAFLMTSRNKLWSFVKFLPKYYFWNQISPVPSMHRQTRNLELNTVPWVLTEVLNDRLDLDLISTDPRA